MEADIAQAAISPPLKVGTRSSLRSSIGARVRSSTMTNAISSTAAARSDPTTVVEPQPSGWLRINP